MKIKKVIIEGFRAYQSKADGTFDFSTSSSDCARFVSIYAPNGFGKTSFYDAVEWALTNNIERFVRDFARTENDNISKSQNQESRRQHILRNRSISESAPSRVTVIGSGFEDVTKDVQKARAGSRDFLFKREKPAPGMEEVAGVFLSQEAIDGFLREEKPDARYARFMLNFGDSDETYRANLIALKRELSIMLKELSAKQQRLEDILATPVNVDIFQNINATIQDLVNGGERIPQVSSSFDADAERELRSLITQRSHELSNYRSDAQRFLADLEAALLDAPSISAAIKKRASAEKALTELAQRRATLTFYMQLKENVNALTETLGLELRNTELYASRLKKVPTFNEFLRQIGELNDLEQKALEQLRAKKAELASFEDRIVACKRLIHELDVLANAFVTLRDRSHEIYRELAISRAAINEKRLRRADCHQRSEALVTKLKLHNESLKRLEVLNIAEESFNPVDLTWISEEGVSPLTLQNAILEKHRRADQLVEARKILEGIDFQKNRISTLISLGSELLTQSKSSECPLCRHKHPTHDALMHNILTNEIIAGLEANAIQGKHLAQLAYDEASRHVKELLGDWQRRKESATQRLRSASTQLVSNSRQLTSDLQALDREIQLEVSRTEKLSQDVMNLPADRFAERIASELQAIVERRSKEESDLKNCEAEAERRRESIKALDQKTEEAKSHVKQILNSDLFIELSAFCAERRIEQTELLQHLTELYREAQARIATATKKVKEAQHETVALENTNPQIKIESIAAIELEEQQYQRSCLEAETSFSVFLSKITVHLSDYDSSWTTERIVEEIKIAIEDFRKKEEVTTMLKRQYSLLGEQLEEVLPYIKSINARKELAQVLLAREEQEALNAKIDAEYREIIERLDSRINGFFYTELINSIYRKIDPHPDFKEVRFTCEFPEGEKPRLHVWVSDEAGDSIAPNLYFSAAQVNILSLSIFLARALHVKAHGKYVGCIFIDDPVHSMDSINVLSTIDLLRTISKKFDRQIILSTHDRNFFELLKRKIPEHEYASKFIELETFGKVKASLQVNSSLIQHVDDIEEDEA